jgi:hypothetical protein
MNRIKTSGSAAPNPVLPVNPVQKNKKIKILYKTLDFNAQRLYYLITVTSPEYSAVMPSKKAILAAQT